MYEDDLPFRNYPMKRVHVGGILRVNRFVAKRKEQRACGPFSRMTAW